LSGFATLSGSCHCENIVFSLQWPTSAHEIVTRTCGCTYCRKHGGIWTSHRDARLAVQANQAALISKYRFGSETADFYICKRCGVVPVVVSEIENSLFAVVNINTFDDMATFTLSNTPTDFDGEGTAVRLNRRKQNWIQHVDISI